jgi:hypothetical protein
MFESEPNPLFTWGLLLMTCGLCFGGLIFCLWLPAVMGPNSGEGSMWTPWIELMVLIFIVGTFCFALSRSKEENKEIPQIIKIYLICGIIFIILVIIPLMHVNFGAFFHKDTISDKITNHQILIPEGEGIEIYRVDSNTVKITYVGGSHVNSLPIVGIDLQYETNKNEYNKPIDEDVVMGYAGGEPNQAVPLLSVGTSINVENIKPQPATVYGFYKFNDGTMSLFFENRNI